jgi:histidinol-phosphatase
MDEELIFAKNLAKEAGEVMLKYFDGGQQRQVKDDGTPVTIADKKINTLVIERIQQAFPDDGIVGEEESTAEYGAGRRWVCDPIDGTNAYTWGVPTSMFSLALVDDGQPVLGVTYDPYLKKLYWGTKGGGSYCNDQKLQVSDEDFSTGIVAVTSDVKKIYAQPKYMGELIKRGTFLASFSGAVYKACLIASGRLVAFTEPLLSPHDVAATQLIVEEAGGRVTALDGSKLDYSKPFKGAVITNGVVHDELVAML